MNQTWIEQRRELEKSQKWLHITGKRQSSLFMQGVYKLLRFIFLFKPLKSFCQKFMNRIEINHYHFEFDHLPQEFDGYTILHMTDFHIDCNESIVDKLITVLPQDPVDLVLCTGDYQDKYRLDSKEISQHLARIVDHLPPYKHIVATLGNHDNSGSVKTLQEVGFEVLINESFEIKHKEDSIQLIGLDDIHFFYSEQSELEVKKAKKYPFTILAVHSPEIFELADESEIDLYLCGHTHGGQVCLPGGKPLVTHSAAPKSLSSGPWKLGHTQGLTNRGLGSSGIPLRVFCPGEVAIITLKKSGS